MREQAASSSRGRQHAAGRLAATFRSSPAAIFPEHDLWPRDHAVYFASIIFQLLTTVMPSLEKLQKEGETGRKKIQEWTRYVTVPLCIVQAIMWLSYMHSGSLILLTTKTASASGSWASPAYCRLRLLMWLGEQIDEYGLGNGISFIHPRQASWPACHRRRADPLWK